MKAYDSRRKPGIRRHVLAALFIGSGLLGGLALSACTAPVTSPTAPATSVVPTASAEISVTAATEPTAIAPAEIPSGIYAMMDWSRTAGQAKPWIKAGHYAFTWRQINPRPGEYDWDVIERWLVGEAGVLEAPTGLRVGLGVNAYEGGQSDAAPEWILDAYGVPAYTQAGWARLAAGETETAAERPTLILEVEPAPGEAPRTLRFAREAVGAGACVDTFIEAKQPETPHAGDPDLLVGNGGQSNILLAFQLAGLPETARVLSASLELTVRELDGSELALEAYALRRAWQPEAATWLAAQPGSGWTIRGANGVQAEADRAAQAAGATILTGNGLARLALDPAMVQGWLDEPVSNQGLLLKQRHDSLVLPRYWEDGFKAAFSEMLHAVGEHFGTDPRIAWVEISVGIYGETTPVNDPLLKWSYAEAGLTSETQEPAKGLYSWIGFVKEVIDLYRSAFPARPLFLQYSNNFESVSERASYVPYAVEQGVGLKHNGLYPDSIDGATYGGPAVGTFNIMFTYSETVPVAWEFQVFPRTEGNVYWALLNALDKRADFVMVQKDAITATELIPIFDFANSYLGTTLETTPGAWVALRETERPAKRWQTQHGNFSFWMTQSDAGPGGKTFPLWNETEAKEGQFCRRTDEATGNRYIYFEIDDRYFHGEEPLAIEVTYLDRGKDTWRLEYDAGEETPKALPAVEKTDSGEWKTERFILLDAQMAGGMEGYDFRLDSAGDGDEIIHLVWAGVLDH